MRRLLKNAGGLAMVLGSGMLVGCGGGDDVASPITAPRLAFVSTQHEAAGEIYVRTTTGNDAPVRLTNNAVPNSQPALSKDGRQLAYVETGADGNDNLWVLGLDERGYPIQSTRRQVTNDALGNGSPTWAPHGTTLYFARMSDDPVNGLSAGIFELAIAQAQAPIPVLGEGAANPSVSPTDSALLAFSRVAPADGQVHLHLFRSGAAEPSTITVLPAAMSLRSLCWSPDGTHLAFERYATDGSTPNGQIVIVPAVAGATAQAVTDGATNDGGPSWIGGARLVFFSNRGSADGTHHLVAYDRGTGAITPWLEDYGDVTRARR
jgi:Tol biopolymer transport system component